MEMQKPELWYHVYLVLSHGPSWKLMPGIKMSLISHLVFPFFPFKIYGEKNTHYSFSFNLVCSYLAKNGHLPCIKFIKYIFVLFLKLILLLCLFSYF